MAIADTLRQALIDLVGEVPDTGEVVSGPGGSPTTTVPGGEPSGPDNRTVDEKAAQLLEDAEQLFLDARAALEQGDLGEYQAKTDAANEKVSQALKLLASVTTTSTTTPESTTTTTAGDTQEAMAPRG